MNFRRAREMAAQRLGKSMHSDPLASEFVLGLMLATWGAWAWGFDSMNEAPTFRVAAEVAPSWLWGLVSILVGVGQFWASLWRGRTVRRALCLGAAALYFAISVSTALGNVASTAAPIFFWLGIGASTVYVRLTTLETPNGPESERY